MADVSTAIEYGLDFEDPARSGVVTDDSGGRTRFGVAERFHPELTSTTFYTTMPQVQALHKALDIYNTQYCNALCIAEIAYQDVANRLFSYGINMGIDPASMVLQDSVGAKADGVIGPFTLQALEKLSSDVVVGRMRMGAEAHYMEVVKSNPQDAKYLNGWIKRARA